MTTPDPAQRPSVDTDLPYEEIVAQLEQTLEQLENGGLRLDDAVDAYGRGVALAARAQQLLDESELKIEQLRAETD